MAAVKIQNKNCLQSNLRKKIINTLFASLGRSVLRKTVSSVLSTALGLQPRAVLKSSVTVFPIRTSRPANNIYVFPCKLSRSFQVLRIPQAWIDIEDYLIIAELLLGKISRLNTLSTTVPYKFICLIPFINLQNITTNNLKNSISMHFAFHSFHQKV